MKEEYLHYPANYFTATINEWKLLLANNSYVKHLKIIIIHQQGSTGMAQTILACCNIFQDSKCGRIFPLVGTSRERYRFGDFKDARWKTYAGGHGKKVKLSLL